MLIKGYDPEIHDIKLLPRKDRIELLEKLEEGHRRKSRRLLYALHPEEDTPWDGDDNKEFRNGDIIYSRHKYPKHMEFFRAGKTYTERCLMAANRCSKTLGGGGFETTTHLIGEYRDWWDGKVFNGPIRAWACGKTNETTRDIVQATLLGDVVPAGTRKGLSGTGLIPAELIGEITWKQGVQDLVDTVKIKWLEGGKWHGGWSLLGMKSYQQGRGAFEGTAQHVIWGDEEMPIEIYGEMLIRTATTGGIMILTFTPLEGLSDVVMQFMPEDQRPSA